MSYPPPYTGQYPDIYDTGSSSTPHPQQPQQPPGAYPQWETLEHELQSLQSSHHSTPLQTPTSASFRPIELEEPPHIVPSQAHLSHSGSPMNDAPILLHHPHAVQQQQQQHFEQQQYEYLAQQQQQQQHSEYEHMQEMGPPGSSTLFHPPQPPTGVLRSIPNSRGRAVESHPYYRRTSGSTLSSYQSHDSPGVSAESPATPAAVSPLASSGGGVATPIPTPLPAPPATRATTRRTRSSAKPKPSVRFDAGTKTGSGPARAAPARAGTPVASTSTSESLTPAVPLLRSTTRRAAASTRTSPPSQAHSQATASTGTAASSDSGSGPTPSSASAILQPSTLTTTSTPSSSLPHPSITLHPPPQARPQPQAQALSPRLPLTSIPADMHYSPQTHILTASLELPGVKREHLHVKLGTCYFNHVKFVVVVAKSWPVFWASASGGSGVGAGARTGTEAGGGGGGHDEGDGVYEVRPGAASGEPDVHMRREEEEEEDDGDSTMKTEVTEKTTPMPPPAAPAASQRSRSPSATPTAPSPLNMPSTSTLRADPSPSLGQYGIPKRQASEAPNTSGAAGSNTNTTKTDSVGRIVNPNLRERRFGIMRRVIQVPGTTTLSNIDASLEDGVLTLQIDCGPPYEIDDEVDVPIR